MIHRRALCCVPRSGYGIATLCIFNTRVVEYVKDLPKLLARDAESIATTDCSALLPRLLIMSAADHRSSSRLPVLNLKIFPDRFRSFCVIAKQPRATLHAPAPLTVPWQLASAHCTHLDATSQIRTLGLFTPRGLFTL